MLSDALRARAAYALGMLNIFRFLLLFRHPVRALRDRLNLIKAPLVEHPLRNGLTFWCRPGSSDLMSVWDIFSSQNHSAYLSQFDVSPEDTVIDLGANIGVFALQCAAKGARVMAYEPIADTFRVMLANIHANDAQQKINPLRLGVSKTAGRRQIFLGARNHSMSCSFYPDADTAQDALEIDTIAFTDIVRNQLRIDLLKIDCEGAEFEFFQGLPPHCLRCVQKVVLEYHEKSEGWHHEDLEDELGLQGFDGIKVVPWKPGHGIIYAWRKT